MCHVCFFFYKPCKPYVFTYINLLTETGFLFLGRLNVPEVRIGSSSVYGKWQFGQVQMCLHLQVHMQTQCAVL